MVKKQNIFVGFIALVCAVYLYLALQMNMGTVLGPGPGFVPAVIGFLGLLISLTFLGINLWKSRTGKTQTSEEADDEKIDRSGLKRFGGYLLTLILFILMFQYLGTLIAIFGLVLSLTKISGSKGWVKPLLLALLTSVCCYVVFNMLLSVPLPRGLIFN